MIKIQHILFLLVASFLFVSCEKDEDITQIDELVISFQPVYDDESTNITSRIPYRSGDILLTKFYTYISNIELKNNDKTVFSEDVYLVNLIDDNNLYSYNITSKDVDLVDIEEVNFSIGIPSDLNDKKPSEFNSDHILADNANYWESWNSYIFSKTEGKYFENNNQIGFAYHTGANETFTPVSLEVNNFKVKEGRNEIKVYVDLKKLFEENGELIDINENNGFHEADQIGQMKEWNQRMSNAFSIKN